MFPGALTYIDTQFERLGDIAAEYLARSIEEGGSRRIGARTRGEAGRRANLRPGAAGWRS
ncbi:hypothetical protein [Cohnella rhizosphaerae]|uniref:hypothetical protein n=1 Tax=Cohnella rhizosphaerae TaxID=1457232 RepID=UPI003B8A5C8C